MNWRMNMELVVEEAVSRFLQRAGAPSEAGQKRSLLELKIGSELSRWSSVFECLKALDSATAQKRLRLEPGEVQARRAKLIEQLQACERIVNDTFARADRSELALRGAPKQVRRVLGL